MPSIQTAIVKAFFRLRRLGYRPPGEIDIEKERADLENLTRRFKPRASFDVTEVTAGNCPAEWITVRDTASERTILYLHGGSHNIGSINSHRSLAVNVAKAGRARVLILDFRLAPEHPFPAALKDATAAYRWLLTTGADPQRIVIVGDSSGGGLALSALVALRDAGDPLPAAAVCMSPWVDLTNTGESWETKIDTDLVIEPDKLRVFAQWYLAGADPRTPLASPLFADLRGLPPLLVQVGTDEVLLSDSTRLAETARAAGVDVTLRIWESMGHVWQFSASLLPEARRAIDEIGEFIDRHCAAQVAQA